MATAHETVLQACREWIKTVMGWDDATGATKVIPAERGVEKGPRPALPYLVVNLTAFGRAFGTHEQEYAKSGFERHTKVDRRAILNVQGFGVGSEEWLEKLSMYIDKTPDPIAVTSTGEIVDISEIAGTNIEARYSRDFDVMYGIIDSDTFDPADTVITEITDEDDQVVAVPSIDWS